jgi:hypothetical protein
VKCDFCPVRLRQRVTAAVQVVRRAVIAQVSPPLVACHGFDTCAGVFDVLWNRTCRISSPATSRLCDGVLRQRAQIMSCNCAYFFFYHAWKYYILANDLNEVSGCAAAVDSAALVAA